MPRVTPTVIRRARQLKHRAFRARHHLRLKRIEALTPLVRAYRSLKPYAYDAAHFPDGFFLTRSVPLEGSLRPAARVIYTFWTGENPIPEVRRRGIESLRRSNPDVPVRVVTPQNLGDYILPEHPLHPAYEYLHYVHRADYLRCYFMHFHGGGYADIKTFKQEWGPAFFMLNEDENAWLAGYRNPVRWMTPNFTSRALQNLMMNTSDIRIGQAAFICKPGTPFTAEWWIRLNEVLDSHLEALKADPGSTHRASDTYALAWTQILAQIIDPLSLKYHQHIRYTDTLAYEFDEPYL